MKLGVFLDQIINDGIKAATADYTDPKDKNRLEGSIAGFEACRNKSTSELLEVWNETHDYMKYMHDDPERYHWLVCYRAEVEWVCNVVSGILYIQDIEPLLSWLPTVNGVSKAMSILNLNGFAMF